MKQLIHKCKFNFTNSIITEVDTTVLDNATAVVKQKGGARTYPANQEVTLNADGGGGPILYSPAKKGKDACYSKVKGRYKKWPSAYASGALVKCRKVGAANWGNSKK